MRLLWLCNMMPGAVREAIQAEAGAGGLWVDHVLADLRKQNITIRILCPGEGQRGNVDERCSYATFVRCVPHQYPRELEAAFARELEDFQPQVIHIWGTEYGHTLAMARAARDKGMLDHTVVSIQGLCSVYAGHYAEGVPEWVQRRFTFRDFLRQDNIGLQRKKYVLRGDMEVEALKILRHVIGRTRWDRACVSQMNPQAQYHFCNETLRPVFYEDTWHYEACVRHRIFASSCAYPVKGFHYLLEAMGEIVKRYPDATLAVPGRSFLPQSSQDKLRRSSYEVYLAELTAKYGLEGKITFLGSLSAEAMAAEYRKANVFALPSTIENSPNSLGEAMLLGVPCVSSDVGGVTDLMNHPSEGYVYPSTAPYMLAYDICQVFAMEERAEEMGRSAQAHARKTHDPKKNLRDLLEIYGSLCEEEEM